MVFATAAGALGVVTVRELCRHTRSVLDKVTVDGRPLLVTREGHPLAALVPVSESHDDDRIAEMAFVSDLDPLEQKLLSVLRGGPLSPDAIVGLVEAGIGEVSMRLTRLEMRGLVRKCLAGYERR
jgi:prevent-host-death family protein